MRCSGGTGEDAENRLYGQVKAAAYVYMFIWPVGVPALFATLLGYCRQVPFQSCNARNCCLEMLCVRLIVVFVMCVNLPCGFGAPPYGGHRVL